MSNVPCPVGRLQALAMSSMHMRAVIAPDQLRYLAVPAVSGRFGADASAVPARLRPRDEDGRFVSYAWLTDAIDFDYGVTDMDFDTGPAIAVDTGRAVEGVDPFPFLADELADELCWTAYGDTGVDDLHTHGPLGVDDAARTSSEGGDAEAHDPLED